jgi:hypothetical protein
VGVTLLNCACGTQISGSVHEVARNQIWREHVGKEKRKFKPGGTYQLFDPSRIATVVVKPPMAERLPRLPSTPPTPGTQSARDAAGRENLASTQRFMSTFNTTKMSPRERYTRPMTSSHDVGWEWRPLTPRNPRFQANRRMCAETVYANKYCRMTGGIGPYVYAPR